MKSKSWSQKAKSTLENYFSAELGHALTIPLKEAELAKHRDNFIKRFSPSKLEDWGKDELLSSLVKNPHNPDYMDYWLEYKKDDDFNCDNFGGVGGGSAYKSFVFWSKDTDTWKGSFGNLIEKSDDGDEEFALSIIKNRVRELLAVDKVMRHYKTLDIHDIDPSEFQKAIETAAPVTYNQAFFHKYFCVLYPELTVFNHSESWSKAHLTRLGQEAFATGTFDRDIRVLQFLRGFDALSGVRNNQMLYHLFSGYLNPRSIWTLNDSQLGDSLPRLIEEGLLTIGTEVTPDLTSWHESLNQHLKKTRAKVELTELFQEQGVDLGDPNLYIKFIWDLCDGDVIVIKNSTHNVLAIGKVKGLYRYDDSSVLQPTQREVEWLVKHSLTVEGHLGDKAFAQVKSDSLVAAEIEAILLYYGHSSLPDFKKFGVDTDSELQTETNSFINELPLPDECPQLIELRSMINRKSQVIFYGPPGTGKTYNAVKFAREIIARDNYRRLPDSLEATDFNKYIHFCTFHPMYSYEDFIEGYRPEGERTFRIKPGVFKKVAEAAKLESHKSFFLIIDEINRGNIPKIFGELLTLLETSKRDDIESTLPLSGKSFTVPKNLYLIGTMNTADRSILLLDTALRRRFAFKEMMPDVEKVADLQFAGGVTLQSWLAQVNNQIVEVFGRDGRNLQIGHSYFMGNQLDMATCAEIVRDEIWPLLQEYCYEDPYKLKKIFGSSGVYDVKLNTLKAALFLPGAEESFSQAMASTVKVADQQNDSNEQELSAGEE